MRISKRRTSLADPSFLIYHYLWQNLDAACSQARQSTADTRATLLDIGCGRKPYADLFPGWRHIGINSSADDAAPDIIGDAMRLPLTPCVADVVLCTQVLEHVPRPWELVAECCRVMKPGGYLVLTAPFYWPLHEEPHDFFRYTKYGLQSLVQEAGLEVVSLKADGGDGARMAISMLHYLPWRLAALLRIPLNLLGLLLDKIRLTERKPQNYTLLARKPS